MRFYLFILDMILYLCGCANTKLAICCTQRLDTVIVIPSYTHTQRSEKGIQHKFINL